MTYDLWQATLTAARKLGKERAVAEAAWYFDGNTPQETIRRFMDGITDGDSEILDQIGHAPLSGEFADDYNGNDLSREFNIPQTSDEFTELCTAYEDGYWDAIVGAVEEEAMLRFNEEV